MTMADVDCEHCGHKMSKHTLDHNITIVQTDGCTECDCAIGLARRDDLEDKITDLRAELSKADDRETKLVKDYILLCREREQLAEFVSTFTLPKEDCMELAKERQVMLLARSIIDGD